MVTPSQTEALARTCRLRRGLRYGPLDREVLDLVVPSQAKPASWLRTLGELWRNDAIPDSELRAVARAHTTAILYVHGGGWCVPGTDVQFQQLTPWVRVGHHVYTMNYPLAPRHRFPTQLVSVLRALRYLRAEMGQTEVVLVGESAGGNLASMAAALLANPPLLAEFAADPAARALVAEDAEPDLASWAMPRCRGFSSWYSILDGSSWLKGGGSFLGWELGKNSLFTRGLSYCFEAYESEAFGGRTCLADLDGPGLKRFPPTQLVVAAHDPTGLSHSSAVAAKLLRRKGVPVEEHRFESTHGFVAYPPQLQRLLFGIDAGKTQGAANAEILRFLKKCSCGKTG